MSSISRIVPKNSKGNLAKRFVSAKKIERLGFVQKNQESRIVPKQTQRGPFGLSSNFASIKTLFSEGLEPLGLLLLRPHHQAWKSALTTGSNGGRTFVKIYTKFQIYKSGRLRVIENLPL